MQGRGERGRFVASDDVAAEYAAQHGEFYIVSETYPGERLYAGTSKSAARVRLIHLQAARPFHRYYIEGN